MNRFAVSIWMISLCAATMGCDLADNLTYINIQYKTSLTIPIMADQQCDSLEPLFSIETDSEFLVGLDNSTRNMISNARMNRVQLTLVEPKGGNLDYFYSLEMYVSAQGLDDVLVARSPKVADGLSSIYLDIPPFDMTPYIKREELIIKIRAMLDKPIYQEQSIDVYNTIACNVKL